MESIINRSKNQISRMLSEVTSLNEQVCCAENACEAETKLREINNAMNMCALLLETIYYIEHNYRKILPYVLCFRKLERQYIRVHKCITQKEFNDGKVEHQIIPMCYPKHDVLYFVGIVKHCDNDDEFSNCVVNYA